MSASSKNIRAAAIALFAGLIFAAGLALGGMMDPRKVQGFLDVGALLGWGDGTWDPSLAFVVAGALLVSLFAFGTVGTVGTAKSHHAPWVSGRFELPTRRDIDAKLVVGAILFGVGWGIAGYCPGPALASLFTGGTDILWFLAAMLPGMLVAKRWFS